jgi:hypothetical protein
MQPDISSDAPDTILIRMEKGKYITDHSNYRYIPNSQAQVQSFLKDLNDHKMNSLQRFGGYFLIFIILGFIVNFILVFTVGRFHPMLLIIGPIFIILGIIATRLWFRSISRWNQDIGIIFNQHKNRLSNYYVLLNESPTYNYRRKNSFPGFKKFKLVPKNEPHHFIINRFINNFYYENHQPDIPIINCNLKNSIQDITDFTNIPITAFNVNKNIEELPDDDLEKNNNFK